MIEINSIIVMAMGEALLILLIIVIVMSALAMKRASNDKKAVETLVNRLKKDRTARDEKVRSMLNGKYHYEDGNLDISVRNFSKSERRFYQKFITTYLNRDYESLSKLDSEFDAATDPFFNLELPSSTDGIDGDKEENISQLQKENEKLKEELGVSMKTLGRMLGEYANILDEEKQEAKDDTVEEESTPVSDEKPAEIPLSPVLMEELTEDAEALQLDEDEAEAPLTSDEQLDIAEEEQNSEPLETTDEVPSVDELLEQTQETANETAEEAPADDELPTDSVDELLESIGVEEEEGGVALDAADDLSKDVLDDLEKVANEIDEMVVEEPAEAVESEVDDVDALLAEAAADAGKEVGAVEVSEESSDPDDILEELQKAQDLGQEIENLIDMEQDLDTSLVEEVDKKGE